MRPGEICVVNLLCITKPAFFAEARKCFANDLESSSGDVVTNFQTERKVPVRLSDKQKEKREKFWLTTFQTDEGGNFFRADSQKHENGFYEVSPIKKVSQGCWADN